MVDQTLIPIVISKDDQDNSHEEERQRLKETMMNLASKPWVQLLYRLICIVVLTSSIPRVFAVEHPEDYNRKPNKILMKLYFLKENMHKVITSSVNVSKFVLFSMLLLSVVGGFSFSTLWRPWFNTELMEYSTKLQLLLRGSYEKVENLADRNEILYNLTKKTATRLKKLIELMIKSAEDDNPYIKDFLLDYDIDPDYWKGDL